MTEERLDAWIALLETYPDDAVLLHGATGEVAMDVRDVLEIAHAFKENLRCHEQTQRILTETISANTQQIDAHAMNMLRASVAGIGIGPSIKPKVEP